MADVLPMVERRARAHIARWLIVLTIVVAPAGAAAALSDLDASSYGDGEHADAERQFHELIDQERAGQGLEPLAVFSDLVDGARHHAGEMAESGVLHHNPDLVYVTPFVNWTTLGENVGRGSGVDVLHLAFMGSPPHAANVLNGDYNYAGVGVEVDADGEMWVAVVFMGGPEGLNEQDQAQDEPPVTRPPAEPVFGDISGTTHEAAIVAITDAGITTGCDSTGERYCPDALVTRGQMATFVSRALDLPPAETDFFTDDDGTMHEDAINRLAQAGVTVGCEAKRFCPGDSISREQMAAFLARALDLPAAQSDHFTDDADSPHHASINAVAGSGITVGCDIDRFCPLDHVTRGQMAGFLARAFDLA